MAVERVTQHRLAQLVNSELERLGIYASRVPIYPSAEHGWTATVMANPARVVEYQPFADSVAANLRQRYALKDQSASLLESDQLLTPVLTQKEAVQERSKRSRELRETK